MPTFTLNILLHTCWHVCMLQTDSIYTHVCKVWANLKARIQSYLCNCWKELHYFLGCAHGTLKETFIVKELCPLRHNQTNRELSGGVAQLSAQRPVETDPEEILTLVQQTRINLHWTIDHKTNNHLFMQMFEFCEPTTSRHRSLGSNQNLCSSLSLSLSLPSNWPNR